MEPDIDMDKVETSLLVLFIPSHDRDSKAFWQEPWVEEALHLLGNTFGGATAFPQARGVWRDDARGGNLVYDKTVVIQCYTNEADIEKHRTLIADFLYHLGKETKQGAVGYVLDGHYFEMQFPLREGEE